MESRAGRTFSEPCKRVPLHLVCRRRGAPVGQLRVVHGHQRIRNTEASVTLGLKEAEVARMSDLHLPLAQHLFHIGDNFIERHCLLEVEARPEIGANLSRRHIRNDGPVGDHDSSREFILGFDRFASCILPSYEKITYLSGKRQAYNRISPLECARTNPCRADELF
jgi:hypothetical protein